MDNKSHNEGSEYFIHRKHFQTVCLLVKLKSQESTNQWFPRTPKGFVSQWHLNWIKSLIWKTNLFVSIIDILFVLKENRQQFSHNYTENTIHFLEMSQTNSIAATEKQG